MPPRRRNETTTAPDSATDPTPATAHTTSSAMTPAIAPTPNAPAPTPNAPAPTPNAPAPTPSPPAPAPATTHYPATSLVSALDLAGHTPSNSTTDPSPPAAQSFPTPLGSAASAPLPHAPPTTASHNPPAPANITISANPLTANMDPTTARLDRLEGLLERLLSQPAVSHVPQPAHTPHPLGTTAQSAPPVPVPTTAHSVPSVPVPTLIPHTWIQTSSPPEFAGDRRFAKAFIANMNTLFWANKAHFVSDEDPQKVVVLRLSLKGEAAVWFDNLRRFTPELTSSWSAFLSAFTQTWVPPSTPGELAHRFTTLRQSSSVVAYNAQFRSLVGEMTQSSGPISTALLIGMYVNGLKPTLSHRLNEIRQNRGLTEWPSLETIELAALDVDATTITTGPSPPRANLSAHSMTIPTTPAPASGTQPFLNLSSAKVTPEWVMRAQRKQAADAAEAAGRCRYCKEEGHLVGDCQKLKEKEERKGAGKA